MSELQRNQIKDGAIDNSKVAPGANIKQSKIHNLEADLESKISLGGDTATGPILVPADPTNDLEVATKHYVDSLVGNTDFSLESAVITTRGFKMSWINDSTIQVSRGVAKDPTGLGAFLLATPRNLILTSLTPNTWYYIHIIGNTNDYTIFDIMPHSSITAPTLPSGYDVYKCIGAIKTDATGKILPFKTEGLGSYRKFVWYNKLDFTSSLPSVTGATNAWKTIPLGPSLPLELTKKVIITCSMRMNATYTIYLREAGTSSEFGSLTYESMAQNAGTGMGACNGTIYTDALGNIEIKSTADLYGFWGFYVKGYHFEI